MLQCSNLAHFCIIYIGLLLSTHMKITLWGALQKAGRIFRSNAEAPVYLGFTREIDENLMLLPLVHYPEAWCKIDNKDYLGSPKAQ